MFLNFFKINFLKNLCTCMCMVDFNIGHTFETCGISYLYTLDLIL